MVIEPVADVAAKGLEDQAGKEVAIFLPDFADLAGGLKWFVIARVSNTGEHDFPGGGVGETDIEDHGATLGDPLPTLTGKGGKQFPRC